MASERKIAANRGNATKSAGPRSAAGRQRSSENAYQHGFAAKFIPCGELKEAIERLASEIANNSDDTIVQSNARCAAEAMLELLRIQWTKNELIKGAIVSGDLISKDEGSGGSEFDLPIELAIRQSWLHRWTADLKRPKARPVFPLEALPVEEPGHSAEAIRRMLPQLCKLERYERRAASRRDRAIRNMTFAQKARLSLVPKGNKQRAHRFVHCI
jgi:hypothetical protein